MYYAYLSIANCAVESKGPFTHRPSTWISGYPPVEWLSANQIRWDKLIARSKFDMLKALLIALHPFSIAL